MAPDKTLKVELDMQLGGRAHRTLDPLTVVLWLGVLLTAGGYCLVSTGLDTRVAEARSDVAHWDTKVSQVKSDLPRLTQLRAENGQLRDQIQAVRGLAEDARHYSDMLRQLAAVTPATVWLTSIHIEPPQHSVTLAGVSLRRDGTEPLQTLADFIRRMQAKGQPYQDVSLASVVAVKGEEGRGYSFQVQARYGGPSEVKP